MKIEKNVPIPKTVVEVFSEMEVGDSVLVEAEKRNNMHAHVKYGKSKGELPSTFKAKTKKEGDKVRVWRVN